MIMMVAVATAALAGCGSGGGASADLVTTPDGNLLLVSTEEPQGRPEAGIEGELVWSAGGCLSVTGPIGTFLLLMPSGTSAPSDAEIVLANGARVELGSHVSWGGGYARLDKGIAAEYVDAINRLPETCLTPEVAIVNPFDSPA